jgi:poly(3-hydroxybutyrate) depolymerase
MRNVSMAMVLASLVSGSAMASTTRLDLTIGSRSAIVYAPDKRDNPALVIALHGMGLSAGWAQGAMQFEALADTANFVVAYPQSDGNMWDLGGDKDVNFVLAVIDEMATRYKIDRDRVYVTGFSMGGMLSWYLSCKIPDKIAAMVPDDGFPLYGMSGCSEVRHVPALHIHGSADDFVKYTDFVGSFLPAQVSRYGCPTTPVKTKPYPTGVNGRNAAQLAQASQSFRDDYGPCEKNGLKSEISFITVTGMIHDWASPNKANANDDVTFKGKPFDINGTWEAWNWLKTHSLKGDVPVETIPAHRDTVYNGAFGKGSSGWAFNAWSGRGSGSVVNGEYKVQVDSASEQASGIQLVQNGIILQKGKTYRVKFDAYATSPRKLQANVEQDTSPWASYLPALKEFDLGTSKTTYSYVFTMTAPTDSNSRITFNAGAATGALFLDNVSIQTVDPSVSVKSIASGHSGSSLMKEGSRLGILLDGLPGERVSLGVYDLAGRPVRSADLLLDGSGVQRWGADLSGLSRGVYLVQVQAGGRIVYRSRFLYQD